MSLSRYSLTMKQDPFIMAAKFVFIFMGVGGGGGTTKNTPQCSKTEINWAF